MRLAVVLALVCLLSACASGPSSGERAFLDTGAFARHARAELDARAILQGMDQARQSDERVARALQRINPDAGPTPVTR